ncbi:hypothetical protein N499_0211B, partial [Wolbachia pipientis wVitA]
LLYQFPLHNKRIGNNGKKAILLPFFLTPQLNNSAISLI